MSDIFAFLPRERTVLELLPTVEPTDPNSEKQKKTAAIIADSSSGGVSLTAQGLEVRTEDFRRFTRLLPRLARELNVHLWQVSPTDEDLESVFSYLSGRS